MRRSPNLNEVSSQSRHQTADGVWPGSTQDRVRWVLRQPAVKDLIERNEKFAGEIESAASFLAQDPKLSRDILERSVLKSSDAIINGIRIFISYKTSEEATAKRFLSL